MKKRSGESMPKCDYDTSRGFCASEGLGCFKNEATHKVTVTYTPSTEIDVLKLCGSCLRTLKRLCRKQGYRIKAEKLRGE